MTSHDAGSVTIVVPTRNRPSQVAACVRALVEHTDAPVLVVDNHSKRAAAASVAGLESLSDRVRVVVEPSVGTSRARNAGLAEAGSEIVAFVDDDVIVEPGWLHALCRPFRDPDVTCVVGRIALEPERARPGWLTPDLESWYGAVDLGDADRELPPGTWGYGGNFAVRRAAALRAGGFDERIGPGQRSRYNEDVDLMARAASTAPLWYAAGARVKHRVGSERLTWRWLLHRAFLQGRSNAIWSRNRIPSKDDPLAFWTPRVRDVVTRRWKRTIRRDHPHATRQRVLLEGSMRRVEALGFWLERARPTLSARPRTP
jgi:GT2 family glycosyltransferase